MECFEYFFLFFFFGHQLREVEAKKLYELMEAFKEKDRERESLLQKKVK